MRALAFAAVAVAGGLALLSAAVAPLVREDFDAYAPIFRFDPVRWAALAEGADVTAPVGVFLPEVWKGRGRAYRIRVDAHGERVPLEIPSEPEDRRAVVCVGDSAVFGWDVDAEETFCAQLAGILTAARPAGAPVYVARNLGVPGYSSLQARIALDLARPFVRPAWVVIGVGANDQTPIEARDYRFLRGWTDAEILRRRGGGWLSVPPWMRLAAWVEDRTLFRALARLIDPPSRKPASADGARERRVGPQEYENNLRAMVEAARRRGAGAAIVTVAVTDEEYLRAAEAVADSEGVPYVAADALFREAAEEPMVPEGYEDLAARVQETLGAELLAKDPMLRTTTDHGHPNALGHRLVAEALAARMGVWIDSPARAPIAD